MYTDISEEIADARAEEEVKKAQMQKIAESRPVVPKQTTKVSVDLEEYVALRQMQADLERLLHSLFTNIEKRYGDYRIKDDFIATVGALYPDAMVQRLKELEAVEEGE